MKSSWSSPVSSVENWEWIPTTKASWRDHGVGTSIIRRWWSSLSSDSELFYCLGARQKNLHSVWMNFCQMPLANDPFTHEIELRQYVMLKHVRGLYQASHFFGVQAPCGTTTHAHNIEVNRKDVWIVVGALANLLLCGVDMPDFWRPPPSWLQVRHMRRRQINANLQTSTPGCFYLPTMT